MTSFAPLYRGTQSGNCSTLCAGGRAQARYAGTGTTATATAVSLWSMRSQSQETFAFNARYKPPCLVFYCWQAVHSAELHLKAPFDPANTRINGDNEPTLG